MDQVLFSDLIHPGQVTFVLTVLLFGSAFTLSFLLGSKTRVVKPLIGVLFSVLFLLLGTVAIEFGEAHTPSYTYAVYASLSEALSTHRWLLFQLPIILTSVSLLVLVVYGERISEPYARLYRTVVVTSIAISFASVLLIMLESVL